MIFRNVLLLQSIFLAVHATSNSKVEYQWKYVDFLWNNPHQKRAAINNGNYITNSCIPYDVDRSPDGRTFVTMVRDKGVPATLTTVSNKQGKGGPLLKPYPSWSWNQAKKCAGITSVYRVAITCNHLFVLDCGKVGNDKQCPAQLLIFDLSTDELVERVIIPDKYATNATGGGLLVTPVVVGDGTCTNVEQNAVVFMADVDGYGLVVWNPSNRQLTRIESPVFRADPNAEMFSVNGDSFQLADGVLGMALADDHPNEEDPLLFFRPLASYDMYYTEAKQLISKGNTQSSIQYFKEPSKLKSQSAAQAFTDDGILIFSGSQEMSILCWNRHKPFMPNNIVTILQNDEQLQFASGMKVHGKTLFIMTNRYPKIAAQTIDFTDVNFRITVGNLNRLVGGTNCTFKGTAGNRRGLTSTKQPTDSDSSPIFYRRDKFSLRR